MLGFFKRPSMIDKASALPGRSTEMPVPERHFVLDATLKGPFADTTRTLWIGMGCFWGAERKFWQLDGVVSTAVGYMGGFTVNPTYKEVCGGRTGHTEVVQVVYEPSKVSLQQLLKVFWENHDPTQGMRQGNDVGTQYRSSIYLADAGELEIALKSKATYQSELQATGHGGITTEVRALEDVGAFYFAEDYHQQYLARNPDGYCGIGGLDVSCPIGLDV